MLPRLRLCAVLLFGSAHAFGFPPSARFHAPGALRGFNRATLPPHAPTARRGQPMPRMQGEKGGGDWVSVVLRNTMEGTFGRRGEVFVGLQFLMVFLVAVGPVFEPLIVDMGFAIGLASCAFGLVFGGTAVIALGDNLTPWPKPIDKNQLQRDGVFSLCRHPIYGCLIITCGGLSVLSASYTRLLFTVILYAVLNSKAEKEEQFLLEKHADYKSYMQEVPSRFLPDATKLAALISGSR